jgi:hypothetical protein
MNAFPFAQSSRGMTPPGAPRPGFPPDDSPTFQEECHYGWAVRKLLLISHLRLGHRLPSSSGAAHGRAAFAAIETNGEFYCLKYERIYRSSRRDYVSG